MTGICSAITVEVKGLASILIIDLTPLIFIRAWTISSPVLGAAYYRLTLVSLVSEPSSVLPEAWLLITIYFYLGSQQFKQFSSVYSYTEGPRIEPLSYKPSIIPLFICLG